MKILRSGDSPKIDVRANNAARLFYYEEFRTQLDSDLEFFLNPNLALQNKIICAVGLDGANKVDEALRAGNEKELFALLAEKNIDLTEFMQFIRPNKNSSKYSAFDGMRFVYAMAKAQAYADKSISKFPNNFKAWLLDNADFDINDCIDDFLEEARAGFFRESRSEQ